MVGKRGKWVMGIEEGTCSEKHWVLYISDEPRESTPKTKSTLYKLYVSQFDNKLYLKKYFIMHFVRTRISSYITTIKFSNSSYLTSIQYYDLISNTYSIFISCSINILYGYFFPRFRIQTGPHVACTCHVLFPFSYRTCPYPFCLSRY